MPETTPDDDDDYLTRRWWPIVYGMGIKADLAKLPREPPSELTIDQKFVWLQGYDR